MTDDQLELRLRDWYRAEVPADETAPLALRASLTTIPRVSALPRHSFASRRGLVLLAAAALLAAAIAGVALIGSGVVKLPSVPPSTVPPTTSSTPTASASPSAAVVASPNPELATPSSSVEPCATLLAGDALPAVDGKGLEGMGQSSGVYVAGRTPRLWAVNPGQSSATLIASISPAPDTIDVLHISPDGSNALIRLDSFGAADSGAECDGLYTIRTDGSGATRLTTSGRSPTGAFSPDGQRVAYSLSGAPGTITTLDLETGATVNQLCGSDYSNFEIHWSPSGQRIAVSCDFSLTILDAAGTTAPVRFMTGGNPLAFSWTDDRHLVVATDGGDLYSFDVESQTSSLLGRFADAEIEIVSTTGVFSPDGLWLAYHGGERGDVPGNDFTGGRLPGADIGRDTDPHSW